MKMMCDVEHGAKTDDVEQFVWMRYTSQHTSIIHHFWRTLTISPSVLFFVVVIDFLVMFDHLFYLKIKIIIIYFVMIYFIIK
jgi:hypothetical protein